MLAAVSFGTTAHAAQYLYTVGGVVVGEEFTFDEYHLFDPQQGDAFEARFLVDDASPLALYDYSASGSSATGGGLVQLGTRTPVTASLTIGTSTYEIRKGDLHLYSSTDPLSGDPIGPTDLIDERGNVTKDPAIGELTLMGQFTLSHSCCWPHPNDTYSQYEDLDFTLRSAAFTDPDFRQTGTFALSPFSGGGFYKNETIVGWLGQITQIILRPQTLTIAQVSAVPEIGTWLMMILGAGMTGLAARSRRIARPAPA